VNTMISRSLLVLLLLAEIVGSPGVQAQMPITIDELVTQQKSLNRKSTLLKGILVSGHAGVFLKDDKERVAVRIRFGSLPQWASGYTPQRDELYRKLEGAADLSLVSPPPKYRVELTCLVSILDKDKYDVYTESPLEIFPLRVILLDPLK